MVSQPVRWHVERAEGAQASLAEGDAGEARDVETRGGREVALSRGEAPAQRGVEEAPRERHADRRLEQVRRRAAAERADEVGLEQQHRAVPHRALPVDRRPKGQPRRPRPRLRRAHADQHLLRARDARKEGDTVFRKKKIMKFFIVLSNLRFSLFP